MDWFMNSPRCLRSSRLSRRPSVPLLLLLAAWALPSLWPSLQGAGATNQVTLWDTVERSTEPGPRAAVDRAQWKRVPTELFSFESDPAKASSDPGYYGRDYTFKGDVVVENSTLTAVFSSARGRVALYSKPGAVPDVGSDSGSAGSVSTAGLGALVWEFSPWVAASESGTLRHCEVLRNAGDEVVLEATFTGRAGKAAAETVVGFAFGKDGIVEFKPGDALRGIRLICPLDYAVVPGFIGDDLIFKPADYPGADTLTLPAESLFVGLLQGEGSQLALTWPKGPQQLKLKLGNDPHGRRMIESLEFHPAGQRFYLSALSAPGIWHREELKAAHLEKDVALTWTPPFPAKWKTQLTESSVKTTFALRDTKGQIWRGVPGSYEYPAWIEGGQVFFHLGKKVPPKGESVIYFVEGQNTPTAVATPVDVLKSTLGRSVSEPIVDSGGRKLRTHHRRGGEGVHRSCTCGYTEAIQGIFEEGQEVSKKDFVQDALADMNYFVQRHVDRIEEYRRFAGETAQWLRAQADRHPPKKAFLDNLAEIVQQIPKEYEVQKENMKSAEYAAELTGQTMALTAAHRDGNLAAFKDLLKAWRGMGGAQDYVVAQCHMITRRLFQEAGYGSVQDERLLAVAQEVRARCRQVLRNPDGYEIWADY